MKLKSIQIPMLLACAVHTVAFAASASGASRCESAFASKRATKTEAAHGSKEEWRPSNAIPESRWGQSAAIPGRRGDRPSYMQSPIERHGIIFGPGERFDATFNPAAWTATEANGREKVMLLIRGEENRNDSDWKRHSSPYLASSYDGIHFKLEGDKPLFLPTESYEMKGGIEDPRYFDMRLSPYRDPSDGKTFDGAIFYVAYDGTTARIATALFNHADPTNIRKVGLLFDPSQVRANPLITANPEWNKSPGAIQYRDPATGKVRNVIYVGEGNTHHGGIMAFESSSPLGWDWSSQSKPVVRADPSTYTSRLVEIAYPPVIGKLPPELVRKTGQTEGIYVHLHGDSRPRGYQVGYAIFSLSDPTGKPIYKSREPFLWPKEKYEIDGQVGRVVFASGSAVLKQPDGSYRRFIYYGGADSVIGAASTRVDGP